VTREALAEPLASREKRDEVPQQVIDIAGGPGRTRTSNQTVMSGRGISETPQNQVISTSIDVVCSRSVPVFHWPIIGRNTEGIPDVF
jgi:hypothetical protein